MPSGVEHNAVVCTVIDVIAVSLPVMPSGVEHVHADETTIHREGSVPTCDAFWC